LSTEYKLESETSTGSALLLYTSSLPTPPPASSSPPPVDSPPSYNIMSQHDLNTIIRQQQEQLVAMQMQIQALLAKEAVAGREARGGVASTEMARP